MSKYDVSIMSKRIKVGDYIYPDTIEYEVIDKYKEGNRWMVLLENDEGRVRRPLADVVRDMSG